ncbi:MAG TPA: stage II sporulation protein M [Acidobacteriota bacterium]|nr:stage II sporulation protein M [Acidobacteriota bacterium]
MQNPHFMRWVIVCSLVATFLVFCIYGFVLPKESLIQPLIERSKWIATVPIIVAALFIFVQNCVVIGVATLSGIIVVPTYVLVAINGFAVGTVLAISPHSIWSNLAILLPHGIIELLAATIGCTAGLREGYHLIQQKPILWKKLFKTYFLIVVPLLALAAVIEALLLLTIR